MFIVQVLGIVQLSMFVRGRIFLFIFGGEDLGAQRYLNHRDVVELNIKVYIIGT